MDLIPVCSLSLPLAALVYQHSPSASLFGHSCCRCSDVSWDDGEKFPRNRKQELAQDEGNLLCPFFGEVDRKT